MGRVNPGAAEIPSHCVLSRTVIGTAGWVFAASNRIERGYANGLSVTSQVSPASSQSRTTAPISGGSKAEIKRVP